MEGESSTIKMEATMMGSGKIIRCMGGVNCSMKVENLLMRAIGHMTSFMGSEKCTMITLSLLTVMQALITLTLTFWMTTGSTMKECWRRTPKRDVGGSNFPTGKRLKGTSTTIGSRGLANSPS